MSPILRLPFFPVPAEGETVFSVIARCAERLGISNRELMLKLTGQRYTTTLFSALPGHLERMTAALPDGHPWRDVSGLIQNNTALNYFTFFDTPEKKSAALKLLSVAGNSWLIALGLGLSTYRTLATPKNLRFCPGCAQEQAVVHGFAYFLLAHQLPGVSVCWKHRETLCDGCINCGPYPLAGKRLTMPYQCLCSSFKPRRITQLKISPGIEWFAQNSNHLVTSKFDEVDRGIRLRHAVVQAGFCRGSLIDYHLLAKAIEAKLGSELLEHLGYPVLNCGYPSPWLRRYFSKDRNRRMSTIPGLLISSALFDSIKCLDSDVVVDNSMQESTSLRGEPSIILSSNLLQALHDHDFRISSCAASLGKTPWNVAIEARDEGITVPLSPLVIKRLKSKSLENIKTQLEIGTPKKEILKDYKIGEWTLLLIELSDPGLKEARTKQSAITRSEKHRKVVLNFMGMNPLATRSTIMNNLPSAYSFLIETDKPWFYKNVPKASRKRSVQRSPRKNWKAFDVQLAAKLYESAKKIADGNEKPRRVTATLLLRQHGSVQQFYKRRNILTKTESALQEIIESPEQYLLRKTAWAVKQLIDANEEISLENLRRKSCIPQSRLSHYIPAIRRLISDLGGAICKKSKLYEDV